MGWFKKKTDPISDRARALSSEIAALEAQIKKLDSKLEPTPPQPPPPATTPLPPQPQPQVQPKPQPSPSSGPRLRSTAHPHGAAPHATPQPPTATTPPPPPSGPSEPIFEEVDQDRLKDRQEPASTPDHFNELGVRKYDLAALFRRIKNHFRGPSTANPKLVNYLAAGSIQGLRPMRYEKRVARNRFVAFAALLFLVLVGLILVFIRHNR
ncbi:MAG: hypothetical protein JWR19_1244 [Pedosphaera sp.]|nr:hypothetical protein [Pedosphaera sp.]